MPLELIQGRDTAGVMVLDLRKIAPPERCFRVFQAFEATRVQDDFCIVSDTDPQLLKKQFEMEMKDRFEWNDLQSGPDIWQVLIVKRGK